MICVYTTNRGLSGKYHSGQLFSIFGQIKKTCFRSFLSFRGQKAENHGSFRKQNGKIGTIHLFPLCFPYTLMLTSNLILTKRKPWHKHFVSSSAREVQGDGNKRAFPQPLQPGGLLQMSPESTDVSGMTRVLTPSPYSYPKSRALR